MQWIKARSKYFTWLILGAIFVVSRILYNRAGIGFDAGTLTRNWQFIDIYLLKHDLWRSIFYLHTQPPLMNLLTGITLQLFPETYESIFRVFFLLCGFVLMLSIYFLGNKLGLPTYLSFLLAAWFSVSPATVLYENRFIYAYPTLVLLVVATVFFGRIVEHKRVVDILAFSLSLAVMALTWGLFHLVWILGCFGIVFYLLKGERRKALWLLPAFLLVFGWYAKNGILYGSFTSSSWAGLNLFKVVTIKMPGEVREQWIKEGKISELALVPPYRSPEVYLKYFPDTPITGIPLLDEYEDSTGYRNQHHYSYVFAGKGYLKDSIRMIIIAPQYYLSTLPHSLYIFLHSASDYKHLQGRDAISGLDTLWNRIFYGQWQKGETPEEMIRAFSLDHVAWWLTIGFFLALIGAPVYLWRQKDRPHSLEYGLVLFMFLNIAFISAAGIMLDIGENNRTRLGIDPLIMLLSVLFIRKLFFATRHKREASLSGVDDFASRY